jgi:hypothetical protein
MFRRPKALSPREFGKYCAYALILLAPGSFVLLPVLWLVRLFGVKAWRQAQERAIGTEHTVGGEHVKVEVDAAPRLFTNAATMTVKLSNRIHSSSWT